MSNIDETIKRVSEMESILDQALEVMDKAKENKEKFLNFQDEIKKLAAYYESQNWKDDFALDEAGALPKDLKRGVLSEDGIHNALERNKELLETIGAEELPRSTQKDDEDLEKVLEALSDFPDLVQQLTDAYKDYSLKLQCMVDASKQTLEDTGLEHLPEKDVVDLEKLQLEASEEFFDKKKKILIQAILRKQGIKDNQEAEINKLETELRRLKKLNTRAEVGHKVYPNDPCPCGSGKKYKKCCGRN